MLRFRKYEVTLRHRVPGRDVTMKFRARNLEHATAKAWRWGNWEHWEAVTIDDGVRTVTVDAPDNVAGRALYAQG